MPVKASDSVFIAEPGDWSESTLFAIHVALLYNTHQQGGELDLFKF